MIYNFVIPNNFNDVITLISENNTNYFEMEYDSWDGHAHLKFDRKLSDEEIKLVGKLTKEYESFPEENSIEYSNKKIIEELKSLGCVSFIISVS